MTGQKAQVPLAVTPVRVAGVATHGEGRTLEVRAVFDGSLIGRVPALRAEDVTRACEHAQVVLERGDFPQHQRARVLERAAQLLSERIEEFAHTIALEAGKPIRTARAEATRAVDTLTFSAVEARKLAGELVPLGATESGSGRIGFALRVPIGVITAITPFNFPLSLVAHKIGPAIAAGCPVVLKPASQTPLSAIDLVELLVEAGPTLSGELLRQGLVDELLLYVAPKLLGPQGFPLVDLPELSDLQDAVGFTVAGVQRLEDDIRLRLRPR